MLRAMTWYQEEVECLKRKRHKGFLGNAAFTIAFLGLFATFGWSWWVHLITILVSLAVGIETWRSTKPPEPPKPQYMMGLRF